MMNLNFGSTGAVSFRMPTAVYESGIKNTQAYSEYTSEQGDPFESSQAKLDQAIADELIKTTKNGDQKSLKSEGEISVIINRTKEHVTLFITNNIGNEFLAREVELIGKIANWLDTNIISNSENPSGLFNVPGSNASGSFFEKIEAFTKKRLTGETTNFISHEIKD